MILIVGLGNPDEKYKFTRHNTGFLSLDYLAPDAQWEKDKYSNSLIAKVSLFGESFLLCKPQTYMNDSGRAVKEICKQKNINLESIIVIQDDLDLPVGEIKISKNTPAKGHNGIKSIIQELGSQDFIRVRIGIERPLQAGQEADYVLENFSKDQKVKIDSAFHRLPDIIKQFVEKTLII